MSVPLVAHSCRPARVSRDFKDSVNTVAGFAYGNSKKQARQIVRRGRLRMSMPFVAHPLSPARVSRDFKDSVHTVAGFAYANLP